MQSPQTHAMEITGLDTASGAKDGTTGTTSPDLHLKSSR